MLPETIQPIVSHPDVITRLAAKYGFDPEIAQILLAQPNARAWTVPGAIILLTDIVEGHRAEMRAFPTRGEILDGDELRAFIDHLFSLFQFIVIYAIMPVQGVDAAKPLLNAAGFRQTGILPLHRLSADKRWTGDDIIFSLPASEFYAGHPRLVKDG